jgi:hypothetical protein
MTDTTVTNNAPSPAPSGQAEVPVQVDQRTTPVPVGNQAPDRPDRGDNPNAQSGRPPSRREAIQAAFERASTPPAKPEKRTSEAAKPAAKPAEAKTGHNNPPEETEKLNLKKRPSDQPIPRGERGQFAARSQAPGTQTAPGAPITPPGHPDAAPPSGKQLPPTAPFRDPPPRMAPHAQAVWADTPEHVRGEVHRMAQEFGQAYQAYKGDNDAMNEIRHFQQMAAQHGTTLKTALTNYVGIEEKLRKDPIGGLEQIIANLRIPITGKPGVTATLRDIAHHVMTRSPAELAQAQQGNALQSTNNQMAQVYQEVTGLKNTVQQLHTALQFKDTRSAVDIFAEDGNHPRFDELGDLIQHEIALGFDLETAYRRAELLRPATHAAQTRTQSAQTRDSDRSISGAPAASASNGATHRQDKPAKSVGRRDAISNAIRKVNGSL